MLLRNVKSRLIQYSAALGITVISVVSFINWYPDFLNLQYPGDILYNYCQLDCPEQVSIMNEAYAPGDKENQPLKKPRYLGVNFGRFFFPNDQAYIYDPPGGQIIFKFPHPINFVGYQFESLSIEERRFVRERNYQMRLYKL